MGEKEKRPYAKVFLRRADSDYGEIREENIVQNDLPEVGKYVVVNEMHVYERAKGDQRITAVYQPSSAYYDAHGFPIIFQVDRYTLGRDDPLNRKNKVVLKRVLRCGTVLRTDIKTLLIATGDLWLEEVDPNQQFTKEIKTFNDFKVVHISNGHPRKHTKEEDNGEEL